ncbi:TPA: hypothetical protein M2P04_004845 [Klebsiella variicola]|uniref:hypothetical protein n=1 Tax=Klebsiella variicola TaxID=244366 RepID=UPI0015586B67|nr:hypothetical protein [Klebsiella variicola]HBZ7678907.1 hypothetical protein [Klebsiella variicola subsp. variicola]HDL0125644.1 hypothetical protein [Klebsiella variicola]
MASIKYKRPPSGDLHLPVAHRQCCRFDGRYVVQAGGIARGLEAQYAEFGDDFMEQFHDDFLTQVQFDNALYVTYITKIESTPHHLTNQ